MNWQEIIKTPGSSFGHLDPLNMVGSIGIKGLYQGEYYGAYLVIFEADWELLPLDAMLEMLKSVCEEDGVPMWVTHLNNMTVPLEHHWRFDDEGNLVVWDGVISG